MEDVQRFEILIEISPTLYILYTNIQRKFIIAWKMKRIRGGEYCIIIVGETKNSWRERYDDSARQGRGSVEFSQLRLN